MNLIRTYWQRCKKCRKEMIGILRNNGKPCHEICYKCKQKEKAV